MPSRAANDLQPAFLSNLDALARTSPTLGDLVRRIVALNDADDTLFLSTDSNAHFYAGKHFLLRVEFTRTGEIILKPHTDKSIYADARTEEAPAFFKRVENLVRDHQGYASKWAELNREQRILRLRAAAPEGFVLALVEELQRAPRGA